MSTRSQRKSTTSVPNLVSIHNKRVENSWVLLVKESLLQNNNFSIISLPHPSTGKQTKYCLDDVNNKIYEIVTFNEPFRSWFIGETVKSDGSMQLLTPMNALFLILPKLMEQCSSRAIPLEDLLAEKGFDKIKAFIGNLEAIADLKGAADMKAYKYNEEKTLTWLVHRVQKLSKVLRQMNVHVTSGAVSATFVTSNVGNQDIDEEFYLKYANGIISEYLPDELAQKLEKTFDFKPELIELLGNKRKSEIDNNDVKKKIKYETSENETKENDFSIADFKPSEVKKLKPLSAKEKARQKAASGTKTISSFFTKK